MSLHRQPRNQGRQLSLVSIVCCEWSGLDCGFQMGEVGASYSGFEQHSDSDSSSSSSPRRSPYDYRLLRRRVTRRRGLMFSVPDDCFLL